ncbi:MAG: isopentenyl transferase family protein, partial [bacterium]|nr:isopentenyl transferase family protein [bacterium]
MVPPQVSKSYNKSSTFAKVLDKSKIIAIVGPTATGKTDLALMLAKKFNGEIISADSRTIYRGLNIGTAKPTGRWTTAIFDGSKKEKFFIYKRIPHHLIDFLSPKKTFSAADFARLAKKSVKKIQGRGKIPIICGGTGFWIETLLNPSLLPDVPPNIQLRRQLEKNTVSQLFSQLK